MTASRTRPAVVIVAAIAALALAAPAHAARLVTWETTSRFVNPAEVELNGPAPGDPMLPPGLRVNVLLPDGFDPQRRYPVLYLLHGVGDRFDTMMNPQRGNVRQIFAGFNGIIVMPEGDRGWHVNWWNGGQRGNPAWERYHLDELIPLVERRLPIRPGRRWHAIAGLSMGGEGTMFYASQRAGYFGSAASFSGALSIQRPEWPAGFDVQGDDHQEVFGDPAAQRFYWRGHNPAALTHNLRHTRLLVRVGDGVPNPASQNEVKNIGGQIAEADLRQHAMDFVARARANGDDITYQPHQGIHDWPYWRADLAAALQWGFFKHVPERPPNWSFRTVARTGWAWGFRFRFRPAPRELKRLTLNGSTLIGAGRGGAVVLRTPGGCRLELPLPFEFRLQPGCA